MALIGYCDATPCIVRAVQDFVDQRHWVSFSNVDDKLDILFIRENLRLAH